MVNMQLENVTSFYKFVHFYSAPNLMEYYCGSTSIKNAVHRIIG